MFPDVTGIITSCTVLYDALHFIKMATWLYFSALKYVEIVQYYKLFIPIQYTCTTYHFFYSEILLRYAELSTYLYGTE